MIHRSAVLVLLASLALGCAASGEEAAFLPLDGKGDGLSQSFVAEHCEAFVDKAAVVSFSQSSSRLLQVYLKAINERLDGEVVEAGFVGGQKVCLSCGVGESSGPTVTHPLQVTAESFLGAPDYFEMTLPVATVEEEGTTVKLEGMFYVLTDRGTRYTVRAEPDDHTNLVADMGLSPWTEDVGALDPIGWLPADHVARRQLNPDGCL